MTRCGPPGQTATERHSTEPRSLDRATKAAEALEEVCPQVAAVVSEMGYVKPSELRRMQRLYDQFIENGQSDYDFGGFVQTMIRRGKSDRHGNTVPSRSVPVDTRVGEFVASRMAGAR